MIYIPGQPSNAQLALIAAVEHSKDERYHPSVNTVTQNADQFLRWLNEKDAKSA